MFSSKDLNNLIKNQNINLLIYRFKVEKYMEKKKNFLLDSETLKIYKNKIISLGKKQKI